MQKNVWWHDSKHSVTKVHLGGLFSVETRPSRAPGRSRPRVDSLDQPLAGPALAVPDSAED